MLHDISKLREVYEIKSTDKDAIFALRDLELNAYIATLLPDPCFMLYIDENIIVDSVDITMVEFIDRAKKSLRESRYVADISTELSSKGADWLMSTDFKK